MSLVLNGQEIAGLVLNGSAISACYNGSLVWPTDAPVAHTLTVLGDGHGAVAPVTASGYAGDTVTLSSTASAGYGLSGWATTGGSVAGSVFTFGNEDATASAAFSAITYTLTLQNDGNGSLSANKTTGHIGDTVTLSPSASAHYNFSGYTQTGGSINGNTFTFSASNATAKAWYTIQTFNITFGEGNTYSAGLTATYNGTNVYTRAMGSAKATATNIPYGSKITFSASSPKYYTFTIGTVSGISATAVSYNGQRDGVGMNFTGYLTGAATTRLANGHVKSFRVQGNWPKPGGQGKFASIYAKPTAFSSWHGTAMSAGSKLAIRSGWTATNTSHQGNSWGAGGDVTAAGWQPRSCSAYIWSGWCDTTGTYTPIYGYIETAGGFATIGGHNSSTYIARSWGSASTQNFYCAGRSAAGYSVVTAINGFWWASGYCP